MPQQKKTAATAIVQAWLLAGSLDIIAACTQFYIVTGKGPSKVLNYIASGIVGKEALGKGTFVNEWWLPVLGIVVHFLIALAFTLIFFWIYPKIKIMSRNKLITGLLYGIFVWCVMNLAVVPLAMGGKLPGDWWKAAQAMLILMFMIGLPISYIIGRYHDEKN
jgi:uncharacterized membrane protein YagU involved in acid resistance